MITDNIVIWEARLSIVDRVHFKTQTLLAYLRIRDVQEPKQTSAPHISTEFDEKKTKIDQLSDVDWVPTNTRSSQGESWLHIFEKVQKSTDETRVQNPQSCA